MTLTRSAVDTATVGAGSPAPDFPYFANLSSD